MDSNNIILNFPFDESAGSAVAYDYSQSRNDGVVTGATFAAGRNGNAIKFAGTDKCEVTNDLVSSNMTNFTMLFYVQASSVDCGSPQKLIWLLNFDGEKNYIEVPITLKPGAWAQFAVTRRGTLYTFYVNAQVIKTVTNQGTFKGISLNQDFYGGEYGLGLIDDFRFYKTALSQQEIIEESSSNTSMVYLVDGTDFKTFGVYVAGSDGVVDRPKLKTPYSINWDNYHGESVDLNHKFFEAREITLDCFIKATSKTDFISRLAAFMQQFDNAGTQRLTISVHPVKPLVYEVYCKDAVAVSKTWNNDLMVGTFKIKLTEPEPVKRVLKHIMVSEATKTATITMKSSKYLNIYWGDGSSSFDVCGDSESHTITHDYSENGEFFIIIAGCIDEITEFDTNDIVVWNKL